MLLYSSVVSWIFIAGAANQAGDADSSRVPGLTSGLQGSVNVQRGASASFLFCFTFLPHLFPLSCGAGSTYPREDFDSSVIMPFSWCVVVVTLPI